MITDVKVNSYDPISDIQETISEKLGISEEFILLDEDNNDLQPCSTIEKCKLSNGSLVIVKCKNNTIKVHFQENVYEFPITASSTVNNVLNLLPEKIRRVKSQIMLFNGSYELSPDTLIQTLECPNGLRAEIKPTVCIIFSFPGNRRTNDYSHSHLLKDIISDFEELVPISKRNEYTLSISGTRYDHTKVNNLKRSSEPLDSFMYEQKINTSPFYMVLDRKYDLG